MNNLASRPRWPEKAAFFLIAAYQAVLSPLLAMGGGGCRHLPTCSHYCKDCIARHGLWAGGWMTLARLCRCHPWGTKGFDPAPETKPLVSAFTPWKYGAWSWKRLPDAPASENADQCKNGVSHGVR
jgi:putative membrane protein insertion efficiency factor